MNAEQRVLIIDSDLKNCKAIKYALTEYGIGAYYTLSVVDGIESLNRHNYELVISDISLSETDGLQLLRFMRQKLDGGECIENVRGVGYRFNDPARKKK